MSAVRGELLDKEWALSETDAITTSVERRDDVTLLAVGEVVDLATAPALEALGSFSGLAHRSQWVADLAGVHYVNDSKGTNVGATLAAVAGMSGPLVVIAGGDGKNQDFAALREAFRGKVRHVVLLGRDAARLEAALEGACTIEHAVDMRAAVTR